MALLSDGRMIDCVVKVKKKGFCKIQRVLTRKCEKGNFCRIERSLCCEGEERDFCKIEKPLIHESGESGLLSDRKSVEW